MNVVIVRDVIASTQVELFFPGDALVAEMKMSIMEAFPYKLNQDALKLVYCGDVMSDFDILRDVLARSKNSLNTPIIHVIFDPLLNDSSSSESTGCNSTGSVVATDDVFFDPVSVEFVKSEVTGGHSTHGGERSHMEAVLKSALKAEAAAGDCDCVGAAVVGAVGGAEAGAEGGAAIPQPRWVDVKLVMRLAVSVAIFCRHWEAEKLYMLVAGCLVYYCLDTGIFRYYHRVLTRWSKRPAAGAVHRGEGPVAPQGLEVEADARVDAPLSAVGALQLWVIGGFYIPENAPAEAARQPEGATVDTDAAAQVALPEPRSFSSRALTFFVDYFSLLVGFVFCLFPSWTVDGMEIPW